MTGERPRVFHLITRLLKGGAEAKTINTVKGLDGYEFVVGHGVDYDPEQIATMQSVGIETVRFSGIRHYNPVTALPAVGEVARYLQKQQFDIVHTHSTEAGIIGRLAAAIADVPAVVHTVHGVPFAPDRNRALELFVLYGERLAATYSDQIITNADAIATDYLSRGIGTPEQYTTVYSGIQLDTFQDASPASEINENGIQIASVGRLADGKGFPDLIAAVDQLDRNDITVYIVGDGPMYEKLEEEIEHSGLSETVQLLGYRDDIPEILSAVDIFTLPSYREGTPRVITEAMATGLPVIATDIAGIPEQVAHGENGYLIQPGDIDGLTKHIQQLCESSSLRQQFGTASQKRAEKFSVQQMLQDIDHIYTRLLAGQT